MSLSSYILILTFSLFSQGTLLSASKSIKNLEDDMVFNTFTMGKTFQKEDTAERSAISPSLDQYKNDESSFLNDEDNKNSKVSGSVASLYCSGNGLCKSSKKENWYLCLFYKKEHMQIVIICIRTTNEISCRVRASPS